MAGILHQNLQQIVFLGRQIHHTPSTQSHTLSHVQSEIPIPQQAAFPGFSPAPGGAAQQGADACLQLHNVERLGHIIVRSASKAHDLVTVLAFGREHDHRNIGKGADLHAGLTAGLTRHHPIQNDEIILFPPGQINSSHAIIGGLHIVSLVLQVKGNTLHKQFFIVNYQYFHCYSSVQTR